MKSILNVTANRYWHGAVDCSVVIVDACAYYSAFHRAVCEARRFIALAGWQLDSATQLSRLSFRPRERQPDRARHLRP